MPIRTASEAATGAKKFIQERYSNPGRLWGYDWGFWGLNNLTGGIQFSNPTDYIIVAARSNVGKSAYGMTVALTVAFQFMHQYPDKDVRIILLEMDAVTCMIRLLSQLTGVPIMDIRRGEITPEQKARLDAAADKLAVLPLVFAEGSHAIGPIERFIEKPSEKTGRKCGFWLLDHIGIVPTEKSLQANQAFSLGELSARFQSLCRRHAPGMVLAQLNRESVKSKDGRPNVSQIFGSDKILQDADLVLLLDRPELRQQLSDEEKEEKMKAGKPEVAEIIVGKNRNGALADFQVLFHPRRAAWTDPPRQQPVQQKRAVA